MISFDTLSTGSANPGTSISYAHVCNGSNRLLIVALAQNGSTAEVVPTVTYNGVTMTQGIKKDSGYEWIYFYYLINPASGSNTLSVTWTGSNAWSCVSASYKGCLQSAQPDGTNSATGVSTSIQTSITTTLDNCWNIAACVVDGTYTDITAGTNINSDRGGVLSIKLGDSNGPKLPAGAYAMTWTFPSHRATAVQISIGSDGITGVGGNPSFITQFV